MDTRAVRLTRPTTKRVVDFHHQAIAHGGRTTKYSDTSNLMSLYIGGEGEIRTRFLSFLGVILDDFLVYIIM